LKRGFAQQFTAWVPIHLIGMTRGGNDIWGHMKLAGFFLLVAGWAIVLAATALLAATARTAFVLAGIGVEVLGLALAARSHRIAGGGHA
jgi:hypothetical protein